MYDFDFTMSRYAGDNRACVGKAEVTSSGR
jgi:hypothetical protein